MNQIINYNDIIETPNLWKGSAIFDIQQFEIANTAFSFELIPEKLRLGMFAEQVIFQSLENNSNIQFIEKNRQIFENNITLGEIDCLLYENGTYTHLEIVYKFYLFDPKISTNELECWIGPNRKDSLVEKLNKLRDKQFPLLYHKRTQEVLNQNRWDKYKFDQKTCFKAQLYIPFNHFQEKYELINTDCIIGYYYRLNELSNLKGAKFFIPSKLNWLNVPKSNLDWISFDAFYQRVELLLNEKRSPLCFVKNKKGNLSKIFVVWWD